MSKELLNNFKNMNDEQVCVWNAEMMVNMGYNRKEIEDALSQDKYNDITSTYFLLAASRGSEVSKCCELSTICTVWNE